MKNIEQIADECIDLIPQSAADLKLDIEGITVLQEAIRESLHRPAALEARANIQATFLALMDKQDSDDAMKRFLHGWRATHTTTSNVSTPVVSKLVMASMAAKLSGEEFKSESLLIAANHMVAVVAEDQGLKGPHAGLYDQFAIAATGNTDWQNSKLFEVPACNKFADFIKGTGQKAPLDEAILIAAASEFSNAIEYTYLSQGVVEWIQRKNPDYTRNQSMRAAGYILVHAGKTEYAHFLNAVAAWQVHQQAQGLEAKSEHLADMFEVYQDRVGKAFGELRDILAPESRPSSSWEADLAGRLASPMTPFGRLYL